MWIIALVSLIPSLRHIAHLPASLIPGLHPDLVTSHWSWSVYFKRSTLQMHTPPGHIIPFSSDNRF